MKTAGILLLGLLVAVAPSVAAPGSGPERPVEPMARIAKDILDMQNDLLNAKMRLQRGVTGTASDLPEGVPLTPARSCCSRNLDSLTDNLRDIIAVVDRLYVHYSANEDAEAMQKIAELRLTIRSVGQGLLAFQNAPTEARASAAMMGLTRPFNQMRSASEKLAKCCPLKP